MDSKLGETSYGLAVRALIKNDEGKCLMLRRSADSRHFPGIWEWPGGKTEPGESFDAALQREVAEETGFHIRLKGVVGAYQFTLGRLNVAMLCMEAEPVEGQPELSEEHEDYQWLDPDEVFNLDLTPWFRDFFCNCVSRKEPDQ